MDLKAVVEDSDYEDLKTAFLLEGTDLKPGLNIETLTNKTLIQLHYLREEGQRSWHNVDEWVQKIRQTETVTDSNASITPRFRHQISRTFMNFETCPVENRHSFLSTVVDFNFLSDTLSSYNITRANFHQPPETFQKLSITNGCVIDMERARGKLGYRKKVTIEWIHKLTSLEKNTRLDKAIKKVMKNNANLLKNSRRKPEQLLKFRDQSFSLPAETPKRPGKSFSEKELEVLQKKQARLELVSKENKEQVKIFRDSLAEVSTEKIELQTSVVSLEKENSILKKQRKEYHFKFLFVKSRLKSALEKHKDKIKRVRSLHEKKLGHLRHKIDTLEVTIKNLREKQSTSKHKVARKAGKTNGKIVVAKSIFERVPGPLEETQEGKSSDFELD